MAGGSTGYSGASDIPDFMRDNMGLVFMGLTSGSLTLSGTSHVGSAPYGSDGSYADNPSVLRYVKDYALTGVGGNPYTGVDAYDSTNEVDAIQDSLLDAETAIDNVDVSSMLSTSFSAVVDKLSDETAFGEMDITTLIEALIGSALTQSIAQIQTVGATSKTLANDHFKYFVSSAKDEQQEILSSADAFTRSMFTSLYNIGVQQTKGDSAVILQDAKTQGISIAESVTSANTPDMSIFTSALSLLGGSVQASIRTALNEALHVVDMSVVNSAVKEYEKGSLREHLRGINRFAGGMADINATMSSTFVLGTALLESDFQNKIQEFRSNLVLNLFDKTFDAYIKQMQVYTEQFFTLYTSKYNAFMQAYGQTLPLYVQNLLNNLPLYIQSYLSVLTSSLSGIDNKIGMQQSYSNPLIASSMNNLQSILSEKVKGLLTIRAQEQQNKAAFLIDTSKSLVDVLMRKSLMSLDKTKLDIDANRIIIDERMNEREANLDIDAKESMWDLTVFQTAANVFSAANGSVVPVQHGPNKSQRVTSGLLSGATSGASMGASIGSIIPGVGTAIGGGVGAVLGGIAGIL